MNGLQRGAMAVASTIAILGTSLLGVAPSQAEESAAPESAAPADNETPLERVSALVQPSIVYLQLDWTAWIYDKIFDQYINDGQPFELSFQCTGFVVNPDGYIASAGHCVDQEEVFPHFQQAAAEWAIQTGYYGPEVSLDLILDAQPFRIETMTKMNRADLDVIVGWGAAASGIETAEIRRARVLAKQKFDLGDVALLKVEATGLNAMPIDTAAAETGNDVVAVGYPASVDSVTDPDLTPSFKDGSISSVKTVQGGLLKVYEISAAVSGGMSGGPTVNLDGAVIGVNSFRIADESQPFNFVRPASQLMELLADRGVENVISEETQAYYDGLAAYWDGDKTTALEKLEFVTQEQPSNKLAAEYLDKARDLPDPPKPAPEESGFPIVPVAIGGGALVLVAAGVVLVLVLRRRKRPATTVAAPALPTGGGPQAFTAPRPPQDALPPPVRGPEVIGGPASPPPPAPATPGAPPPPSAPMMAPGTATMVPPVVPDTVEGIDEHPLPKFCGECGTHSHPGEKFCENCGHPLVHG